MFHQHQFSSETLPNSFTEKFLKTPKKSDSILSFLKESGFSKTHLETVIIHAPRVLYANLDQTIKPRIKIFQDLGFSPTDTVDIVSAEPWILSHSANKLGPSILELNSVLGSNAGVSRFLKICGWFLKCDLEKTMMPNVEFLKSFGVSSSQIVKYIYNFPRLFLHKPERIMKFVERVDELGMDRRSKGLLNAIRTISSMTVENWGLKLELFWSSGFSEEDIVLVFRKVPQAFAVSERKIKESTRILCGFGKSDISLIVNHPELLYLSVENRLKLRLRVVEILESKKLLWKKPSLATVCKMSHN
ncbi:uncharacterized protein LOC130776204 [Actinidia eriantha]|uniref:uncharacterized protein LOC130776204 n=1 Tax=Actinidia eriantha TaxID=165200 RepID=UPI002582E478|nr:uncharacterized protein LOC130776204 [Actinidia eriantha]XP_057490317.1 uncharacterized protein LOC130776204 [Actinidia eriantha]